MFEKFYENLKKNYGEISKTKAKLIYDTFVETMRNEIQNNDEFSLRLIGKFKKVSYEMSKSAISDKSGPIQVTTVRFKPSKTLFKK